MAAAAGEDTVWIGFMDIVPVIGTVKEAVELVLAVYEGDEEVIKEKVKAIESIVKNLFKKHVKLKHGKGEHEKSLPDNPGAGDQKRAAVGAAVAVTVGAAVGAAVVTAVGDAIAATGTAVAGAKVGLAVGGAVAGPVGVAAVALGVTAFAAVALGVTAFVAAADVFGKAHRAGAESEFSALRNVKEISKEMIIEHVKKGSKQGTKPLTPAQQKERQRKLEAIKNRVLEKIRIINPNFSRELEEELKRSKRGEHVFNNDILRFHCKVLTEFIQSHHIYNLRGYNPQAMDSLGRHTLRQNTEIDIQINMVAHFDEDEFYVNANALMYGAYCRALSGALLDVLRRIKPGDVTEEQRQRVNFVIDNMNNHQIYVDQMAKVKWIANIATRLARFEKVRQEVVTMYNTDRGFEWCIRILHEIAPLFEQRP